VPIDGLAGCDCRSTDCRFPIADRRIAGFRSPIDGLPVSDCRSTDWRLQIVRADATAGLESFAISEASGRRTRANLSGKSVGHSNAERIVMHPKTIADIREHGSADSGGRRAAVDPNQVA
jgi:hypothetical protein